jgi:hypothetical protein
MIGGFKTRGLHQVSSNIGYAAGLMSIFPRHVEVEGFAPFSNITLHLLRA